MKLDITVRIVHENDSAELHTIIMNQGAIMSQLTDLQDQLSAISSTLDNTIKPGISNLAAEVADLIANLGPTGPPADLTLALSQATGIQDSLSSIADSIRAIPPKPTTT